jgi:hypothetical protein
MSSSEYLEWKLTDAPRAFEAENQSKRDDEYTLPRFIWRAAQADELIISHDNLDLNPLVSQTRTEDHGGGSFVIISGQYNTSHARSRSLKPTKAYLTSLLKRLQQRKQQHDCMQDDERISRLGQDI